MKVNDHKRYQRDRSWPEFVSLCMLLQLLFVSTPALAQQQSIDRGSVERSLLPVLGYTSDSGLFGGALWQRNEYSGQRELYDNRQLIQLLASTRGELGLQVEHERVATPFQPTRFRTVLDLERVPFQPYFGIGNETGFNSSNYESGYYDYLHRAAEWSGEWRRTIVRFGDDPASSELDVTALLQTGWYKPGSNGEGTLFQSHYPESGDTNWIQMAGTGLLLEGRDHEVDPRSGYRIQGDLSLSTPWLLSDASFRRVRLDLRHYLPLPFGVTLAQKIAYEGTWGNTPFWMMPTIGNDSALRGYPLNRFRGRASIVHLAELRAWLFSILGDEVRLGAQLFMDTGRVFSSGEGFRELPDGLHQTFGVGGSMTLFHPDLIFRGDLGFSEEMFRIYAGIGYLF
ncbi:MAG: BamA/TamA family outer membrane protein [Balneolaceae bacterium]